MRLIWILVLLSACQLTFPLADVADADAGAGPFELCGPLPLEDWRYSVVDNSAAFESHAAALQQCHTLAMTLASPSSQDEYDFLQTTKVVAGNETWLGVNHTGGGKFSDPEGCDVFTMLDPAADKLTTNGCAVITTAGMSDESCAVGIAYAICEQPRPPTAKCAAPFDASRYRMMESPVLHAAALVACDRPSEHLVVFESEPEKAGVEMLAASANIAKFWLGVSYDSGPHVWSSSSGCPPWFGFQPGEPNQGNATAMHEIPIGDRTAGAGEMAAVICEQD